VVRHISNRVAVMYLGKIVEIQSAATIFDEPLHPYTKALVQAIPKLEFTAGAAETRAAIEGDPPSPINIPTGCRFHPRCPYAMPICREVEPRLADRGEGQSVACHLYPSS
jgi:oligopeptide transport system ATP-binding protein